MTTELDYSDTKSVIKNIKMRRKKFVPPEKREEMKQQRRQLRQLGLISDCSKTISSWQYTVGSAASEARSVLSELTTSTQVKEREIRMKEIEEAKAKEEAEEGEGEGEGEDGEKEEGPTDPDTACLQEINDLIEEINVDDTDIKIEDKRPDTPPIEVPENPTPNTEKAILKLEEIRRVEKAMATQPESVIPKDTEALNQKLPESTTKEAFKWQQPQPREKFDFVK